MSSTIVHHCVSALYLHHTAQGPDIRLTAVALLVQHLRGKVVGGPADCFPPVPLWLQLGSQTKVSHFQLHGLADKEVT